MRSFRFEEAPGEPSSRRVYHVSEITRAIKSRLEEAFPTVWVEGEISNFKAHDSGHFYFSLKDPEAQISCVMWRGRNQSLPFRPGDGMNVLVFGDLTVYERQGRYQLDIIRMQPAGLGELQQAFERLKRKLEAEGLFDPGHKQPIPTMPMRIGVVTSPTGAAIRDITSIINRRFPAARLILAPVRVQGEGAAREIADAVESFNRYGQVDVIIVGRGGGSLEDLWAFNEEIVARAVFDSKIPVVSAVGHEIDFTICDFVADLRAPTPSAAAELVVPDREELLAGIRHMEGRLLRGYKSLLSGLAGRLDAFRRSYGMRKPQDRMREYRFRLDDLSRTLHSSMEHLLKSRRLTLERLGGILQSLAPESVLRRGYTMTTRLPAGEIVTRAALLSGGDSIGIRFADGTVKARVDPCGPSENGNAKKHGEKHQF
ncbi:exodeoxyribonuclease VII large subunit [bacterium]|nr:exodeoxyribonuclease VII large subunit [bacterium]